MTRFRDFLLVAVRFRTLDDQSRLRDLHDAARGERNHLAPSQAREAQELDDIGVEVALAPGGLECVAELVITEWADADAGSASTLWELGAGHRVAVEELVVDSPSEQGEQNGGTTARPTGINRRNLNPLVRRTDEGTALELAWWGFLDGAGETVKWPSINTRSERLIEKTPGVANHRALVPATSWFERQKATKQWYSFSPDSLQGFFMAAVTRPGTPKNGQELTTYSLVMRPAVDRLYDIHDRMPLLVPASFHDTWLDPDEPGSRELVEAAVAASRELDDGVQTVESGGPGLGKKAEAEVVAEGERPPTLF